MVYSNNQHFIIFLLKLLVLSILAKPLGYAATHQPESTITLRCDDWCPYSCSPSSPQPGILIEAAKIIFQKQGYQVNYAILPWTRSIALTRAGKFNAIVGAFKEDAPDFVFPKHHLAISVNSFFVLRDSTWHYKKLDNLTDIRLGIALGYAYGEPFDSLFNTKPRPNNLWVATGNTPLEDNMRMLISKRLDAILENRYVVQYYLKQQTDFQQTQLKEAGVSSIDRVYIAFPPT